MNLGQRVVSLAIGEYHTCALLALGTVRCWGDNAIGQLGYGNTAPIIDPAVSRNSSRCDSCTVRHAQTHWNFGVTAVVLAAS